MKNAYQINVFDDIAEINMYGEIVKQRPIDYDTGQPANGNYIVLDEFLEDLKEIENKSNINIHINSIGGDCYCGLAIYNRLKMLKGHITTINDGLAASAASIIFQAGKTRKVNAGSTIMTHGVSTFLFGYYEKKDLQNTMKELDAHNNAVMNVYMERTGKTKEECIKFITGTNWMDAQTAINNGLADELVTTTQADVQITQDNQYIISNGVPFHVGHIGGSVPQNIPVTANINMEKQPTQKAYADGVMAERQRIKEIEEIAAVINDANAVYSAKYGQHVSTAQELAFAVARKDAEMRNVFLQNLQTDTEESNAIHATANHGNEIGKQQDVSVEETVNMAIDIFNRMKGKGKEKGRE